MLQSLPKIQRQFPLEHTGTFTGEKMSHIPCASRTPHTWAGDYIHQAHFERTNVSGNRYFPDCNPWYETAAATPFPEGIPVCLRIKSKKIEIMV